MKYLKRLNKNMNNNNNLILNHILIKINQNKIKENQHKMKKIKEINQLKVKIIYKQLNIIQIVLNQILLYHNLM